MFSPFGAQRLRCCPAASFTFLLLAAAACSIIAAEQLTVNPAQAYKKEKVIIDTDIGYDIDDAFAVALALNSPELEVLGFTTTSGDTRARAAIVDRMLAESGHVKIPVAVGQPTISPTPYLPVRLINAQKRYGESAVSQRHTDAASFILEQIRRFPGQVTLIAIGPLTNVANVIDQDAASFRKLKRVVMMGGWIAAVDDGTGLLSSPSPEYNILVDIGAAKKLFQFGVPLYVIPIDATNHLAMDEVKRRAIFSRGTPLTNSLGLQYLMWGNTTPVLYDAMAVAFATEPQLCPVKPMHIVLDAAGVTRTERGVPNAQVCMYSDAHDFFDYYIPRVSEQSASETLQR